MLQPLAEVITIGDEILYGQITDTNTQYLSQQLSLLGIRTIRKSSVPDQADHIKAVLTEAASRAQIILVTGGLGPTKDDVTKQTVAQYFKSKLVIHEPTLQLITDFFAKRNRPLLEVNKKQAEIPDVAEALINYNGTAPGIWLEKNNTIYVFLPGVPFEMRALTESHVIPRLKDRFTKHCIIHKLIHTCGIGESFLAETIKEWESKLPKHISLAYLPSLGTLKLRLTAIGTNEEQLKQEVESQTTKVSELIEPYIFGYDSLDTLQAVVGKMLKNRNVTIATAESCTGGLIANLLTSIPGSSAYFKGSIVAYSNEIKARLLQVSQVTLQGYGAVSEQTVKEMAEGAKRLLGTDVALSISGIAGPDGGSSDKPVGTIWIGYSDSEKTIAKKFLLSGARNTIVSLSAYQALNFARQNIS